MNTELRLPNQSKDFLNAHFSAVHDLLRRTRDEAAVVHREDEGVEDGPIGGVERAVDEDARRVAATSRQDRLAHSPLGGANNFSSGRGDLRSAHRRLADGLLDDAAFESVAVFGRNPAVPSENGPLPCTFEFPAPGTLCRLLAHSFLASCPRPSLHPTHGHVPASGVATSPASACWRDAAPSAALTADSVSEERAAPSRKPRRCYLLGSLKSGRLGFAPTAAAWRSGVETAGLTGPARAALPTAPQFPVALVECDPARGDLRCWQADADRDVTD